MDFGQESPKVADLFKADYGQEDQEWLLEKGLLDRVTRLRGTTAPAQPAPSAPAASPHPPLLKRPTLSPPPSSSAVAQSKVSGGFQRTGPLRLTSPAEAGQQHLDHMRTQLGGMGYEVEDKMPRNYSPDDRAQAIRHAATGINFLHQSVPGTQDLSQKHKVKLTFQGPQITNQGVLMGAYHPYEQQPRIELNSTAEQTFWHEYGHFLDHALAGRETHFATDIPGHKLRGMAEDLMQTPEHKEFIQNHPSIWKTQQVRNPETGAMEERKTYDHRRHAYLANHGEVLARFFNGYMNHHMSNAGQTPHEKFYGVEGYQPHQYEHFGGRLRDLLKENSLTRSFGQYLDQLYKGKLGTWVTGKFRPSAPQQPISSEGVDMTGHLAPPKPPMPTPEPISQPHPAPLPQPHPEPEFAGHGAPIHDPELHYNYRMQQLSGHGYHVDDNMPPSYTTATKAAALEHIHDALHHVHQTLPGSDRLPREHEMRLTVQGPQVFGPGGSIHGVYYGNEAYPRIEVNSNHRQTLWHEFGHYLDHSLAGIHGLELASRKPGHELHDFVSDLKARPEHRDLFWNQPNDRRDYLADRAETLARFFNRYMEHTYAKSKGYAPPEEKGPMEEYSPEDLEQYGSRFRDILRKHDVTKGFAEYLDKLQKAESSPAGKDTPEARITGLGYKFKDLTPATHTPEQKTMAIGHAANALEFIHSALPEVANVNANRTPEVSVAAPQYDAQGNYNSSQLGGLYVPHPTEPSLHITRAGHTLWHEFGHHIDYGLGQGNKPASTIEGHPLNQFVNELKDTSEYQKYMNSTPEAWSHYPRQVPGQPKPVYDKVRREWVGSPIMDKELTFPKKLEYFGKNEEVFARYVSQYLAHQHKQQTGTGPLDSPHKDRIEQWTPEQHEYFGHRLRQILAQHGLRRGFGTYVGELNKALIPIPGQSDHSAAQVEGHGNYVARSGNGLSLRGYNVENHMPADPDKAVQQAHHIRNATAAVEHVNNVLPGFHTFSKSKNLTLNFHHDNTAGTGLYGQYNGTDQSNPHIDVFNHGENTLWHEVGHFVDHHVNGGRVDSRSQTVNTLSDSGDVEPMVRKYKVMRMGSEEDGHPLNSLVQSLKTTPEHQHFINNTKRVLTPQGTRDAFTQRYLGEPKETFSRFFSAYMNHMHRQLHPEITSIGTDLQDPAQYPGDEERWNPDTLEKHGRWLRQILQDHGGGVFKSFAEHLDKLEKALEETRQSKPLPGAQRAARMPSGYKIPRKITRPGVRGSTLWWIDPKTGTVRYGPKPKPRDRQEDESGKVKDYLESAQPWSFMSAHSDTRSSSENDQLHAQLGQDLQSQGYQVYPSQGYYTDPGQTELRQEPSYFVVGMGTKDALPLGQKYGQQTVLTHDGMFNFADRSVAPISYKQVTAGDLPKDHPQTVILTQPSHVTMVIDTGQPQPLTGVS